MKLSETELRSHILRIQLYCLEVILEGFVEVFLLVVDLAKNEIDITAQQQYLSSKIRHVGLLWLFEFTAELESTLAECL
mgnify:FL=1|jgi:hypothetical protein